MATKQSADSELELELEAIAKSERRRSSARKEEILRTALKLFMEQGYGSTPLRQIASATNTSASLIIYHFGTKQAIAHAILKEKLQEVRGCIMSEIDIRTEPELFCCAMVRLFQTVMSSDSYRRFYHDMIEEGLFREFFFSSDEGINASVLILAKRKVQLSPELSRFYSHYIIPSVEMALWIAADKDVPQEETLDIPFRSLMGLLDVPRQEVDNYCDKSREIVQHILEKKPSLLTFELE